MTDLSGKNAPPGERNLLTQLPILDAFIGAPGDSTGALGLADALSLPCMIAMAPSPSQSVTILHVNDAQVQLTGFSRAALVGASPKVLHGEETDMASAKRFRTQMEERGSSFVDVVNYRKDGTPYEVFLLGSRLKTPENMPRDGRVLYVAFSFHLTDDIWVAPEPARPDPEPMRKN